VSGPARLLIRLGSLGDVVLATAAANAARAEHGDGCVDVLVKSEWAPIWDGHPAVRRVLAWPREERGASGLARWASRLREERYVETFDLQSSPRTRSLTAWAGLPAVRRPRRMHLERRLLVWTHRWGPPAGFSVAGSFAETVRPGSRALPSVHPGPEARARAASLPIRPGAVGIVPGARYFTKRWPLERFTRAGRALHEAGAGPVPVFFGPDEGALLDAWRALWPPDGGWLAVREDLGTVAAALGGLSGLIANDTGLAHLAAAMGTPVVVILGPTVRAFGFAPVGEGHRILEVEGLSCRPCTLHGSQACPRVHFRCMADIETGGVVSAALSAAAASARALPQT
jgi:heptosyltransferase-2